MKGGKLKGKCLKIPREPVPGVGGKLNERSEKPDVLYDAKASAGKSGKLVGRVATSFAEPRTNREKKLNLSGDFFLNGQSKCRGGRAAHATGAAGGKTPKGRIEGLWEP